MDKDDDLPFEVGQLIEARSFLHGFRGAWFRCEIKQISWKKGYMQYLLEYFDFPDEKETWTKVYQVPCYRKKGGTKRQLMVRPQYPPIYLESLMPHINSIREVTVVITGGWNVGDLVDWWKDDCYWSGKLTKLLGNGKAEMEFPLPPMGEGSSYEVSFQDLRPSLDWSPEDGWRVPTSVVGGKCHQCARLIYPVNQADGDSSGFHMPLVGRTSDSHVEDQLPSAPTFSHVPMKSVAALNKTSGTSKMLEEPLSLAGKTGRNMNLMPEVSVPEEATWAAKNSSLNAGGGSAKTVGHIVEEDLSNYGCPPKKLRTSGGNSLNSLDSDKIEAAFLGLEELANKIKWLKGLLEVRTPSNDVQHSWKFIEHHAPSMQK